MPDKTRTGPSSAVPDAICLVVPADTMAVRDALSQVLAAPLMARLTEGDRGTAEIVLAEVMNNIVEHAYRAGPGEIHLTLRPDGGALCCRIEDRGCPMPGETLPEGKAMPLGLMEDLPEGGFGWYLIRTLAHDLTYRHTGGRNLLTFRLKPEESVA